MGFTKISGPVSNFRQSTEVKSATSTSGAFGMGRTTMKTEKLFNFRVGSRPVSMKFPKGDIDLADGDEATVVGTDTSGGVKGLLVRNEGTGITYGMSLAYWFGWGISLTVLGIVLVPVLFGIVLLPVGLYMLYKGFQYKKAMALLAT